MVFEDDAGRANRIVEKFNLTAENTASIRSEVGKSREPRGSAQAPDLSRPHPKRARRISCWTRCWKNRPKRKRASRIIRQQSNPILLGKRRKNPVRPRLPQRTTADPQRVLLNRRRNLSARSCGRFRRRGSRKRKHLAGRNRPRPKRRRRKRPSISRRSEKKQNQRRGKRL